MDNSFVPASDFVSAHQRHSTSLPKLSILNSQFSIEELPCTDSSPTCLATLGDLAVQNSREIAVLEQAIVLQKKKLWTSWLNADGLNPLAIGLRIARNIAGGGDRAAAKLELARLELRLTEIETNLRQAVALAIADNEAIGHQQRVLQAKRAALRVRIQLAEVAYRLGDGNIEAMWQLWLTCDELEAQIVAAEAYRQQTRRKLLSLLFPPATTLPKFDPRTQ